MTSRLLNVQPWHKVVRLRDDLRTGELPLSFFAADLYDVAMGKGLSVYRDPKEFFTLTYPTFNLREMARDVILRLSGKNDKAVRLLDLTYGGGKTHSLVTLFHLTNNPDHLPDISAVQQFRQHAGGIPLPRARISAMCFDKLDLENGMTVRGPDSGMKQLWQPWSVLAYQIAGMKGLEILTPGGSERDSAPAENVLREILELPQKDGLATLVLIDEVLMFARQKIAKDPAMRLRLQDFFQCLVQAAVKVDRCCVVFSLLATDPRKSDQLGKEIVHELEAVVRRQAEQSISPVEKQDIAEVLRRRFFTPESVAKSEHFQANVVSALEGIQSLDEQTQRNRKTEEKRFLDSFPFHPDLTETLYAKWTNLESFQRTRGVLRTFALALREAEKWDKSPLIGPNVLLNDPGKPELADAARELALVAATEEYEGRKQAWKAILEGELDKARSIQKETQSLPNRELEQAVMATFLHSQPAGAKAQLRDLLVLIGASKPDRIELGKALRQWTECSWFLDDSSFGATTGDLPKTWRLGAEPNLNQMHHRGVAAVTDRIEPALREMIGKERRLTSGQTASSIRVHNLPKRPSDVQDDGDFHFVILGPSAACEGNKPSEEAKRFINETTPEKPRTYRNAIIIGVPSVHGLATAADRVRDYMGWQEVGAMPEAKEFSDPRKAILAGLEKSAKEAIPDAIVQAYSVVVTVSPRPEQKKDSQGIIEAFTITPAGEPLFDTIKKDPRSRIKEHALSPDALLPGAIYDLWQVGETSRRASNLLDSFTQFPHMPKMLHKKEILDTLALGCQEGYFVLRVSRPDGSARTIWRSTPAETDFEEKNLEVVLPEAAELTSLDSTLLSPGKLTGLWSKETVPLRAGEILDFFDGKHVIKVIKQGTTKSRSRSQEPLKTL